jgi:FkbM family methyltransferase
VLKDLSEILGVKCPSLRIVDVGAMDLGPGTAPYAPLLGLDRVEVLGFEPNPEECAKLSANCPPGQRYLPHFVGDGEKRTFRFCTWNATSSLYEPNARLLRFFTGLPDLLGVKERVEVETTRLDDIEDLGRVDYLKIDVQGATLDVLRGGPKTLSSTLVVQAEVEFVQLYEAQPLFAEVELEMRKHGFLFHSFTPISRGAFAPLSGLPPGHGQMLWTDAVFVKSFLDFGALEPEQLLRLALIMERMYGAADLSLLALRHHDAKTGSALWSEYVASITG